MKKSFFVLIAALCIAIPVSVNAKAVSDASLSSAIKCYKAGDYAQSYTILTDIVKKDPSNAVAYYYLAITSVQIGRKDEAIANYDKVLVLSPEGQLGRYANKGKTCLIDPEKCDEESATSSLDAFVQSRFGSGFSNEVRSDFERQKIENFMREMNRNGDIDAKKFKDYKDFSNAAPSNDEIVAAIRTLQRAGMGSLVNNGMSLMSDNNHEYSTMFNMLTGTNKSSLNPDVIQALLTNQLTTGF